MSAIHRDKVAEPHRLLEDPETRDEAMSTIRSLIDRIVLVPEAGALRVDLCGEIAGILRLRDQSKKPTEISGGLSQLKLVAGARNHRELTLSVPV